MLAFLFAVVCAMMASRRDAPVSEAAVSHHEPKPRAATFSGVEVSSKELPAPAPAPPKLLLVEVSVVAEDHPMVTVHGGEYRSVQ